MSTRFAAAVAALWGASGLACAEFLFDLDDLDGYEEQVQVGVAGTASTAGADDSRFEPPEAPPSIDDDAPPSSGGSLPGGSSPGGADDAPAPVSVSPPLAGPNEPCAFDAECASGACVPWSLNFEGGVCADVSACLVIPVECADFVVFGACPFFQDCPLTAGNVYWGNIDGCIQDSCGFYLANGYQSADCLAEISLIQATGVTCP